MALEINVYYDCVAKESLFLGRGWGIRDVRGPYLVQNPAELIFPKQMFHKILSTQVTLFFSLSNRSIPEAIEVSCVQNERRLSETVVRNASCLITFEDVKGTDKSDRVAYVEANQLYIGKGAAQIVPIYDTLALDRVLIERNWNPRVRY